MKFKERHIQHGHNSDGLDRRGFLECMAWAGTGMLWTVSGGLLGSTLLPSRAGAADIARWFRIKSSINQAKFDALERHRTSNHFRKPNVSRWTT